MIAAVVKEIADSIDKNHYCLGEVFIRKERKIDSQAENSRRMKVDIIVVENKNNRKRGGKICQKR